MVQGASPSSFFSGGLCLSVIAPVTKVGGFSPGDSERGIVPDPENISYHGIESVSRPSDPRDYSRLSTVLCPGVHHESG